MGELRLRLAQCLFGVLTLRQIEHEGDALVLAVAERRRAEPARGCRLCESTLSHAVGRFQSPSALRWPGRRRRAIRPASAPSIAADPRRDLPGHIRQYRERLGWLR